MLTPEQQAFVKDAIELGKRQILLEMNSGHIPPTVTTFAELHDYVDANEFGGLCDDGGPADTLFDRQTDAGSEVWCEACNQVQAALDEFVRNRGSSKPILGNATRHLVYGDFGRTWIEVGDGGVIPLVTGGAIRVAPLDEAVVAEWSDALGASDLLSKVPSLGLNHGGGITALTWQEAYNLAGALIAAANIALYG
ncbi:hypothetical protein [Cupriavidus basilensis]|uniref:hypothetical protein n=1 Tax=Cupriavidus basilensis TaxID=68895 RepID=UPI0020A6588A|nr:hypothetical protein [Cupriavidus basilensis]MCP3017424.1 hypothetical protein [Cupriavidus basilensis]